MTPKEVADALNKAMEADPKAMEADPKAMEADPKAMEADPKAMEALLRRIPCNEAFAHDPNVVVTSDDGINGPFDVSALGLVNGLMGLAKMGWSQCPRQTANGKGPWKLVGFKGK